MAHRSFLPHFGNGPYPLEWESRKRTIDAKMPVLASTCSEVQGGGLKRKPDIGEQESWISES